METVVIVDGKFKYFWEICIFCQLFGLAEVLFQTTVVVDDTSDIASGIYFALGPKKFRIKLSAILSYIF